MPATFAQLHDANKEIAPALAGVGAKQIHVGDHAGMPTGALLSFTTQLIRRLKYG